MIVYAYGDIHGMLPQLKRLHDNILIHHQHNHPEEEAHHVFLGDYIDRGPYNKEVLDFVLEYYHKENYNFLAGNHEDFFQVFLDAETELDMLRISSIWPQNGGNTSVASFFEDRDNHDALKPRNWTKTTGAEWRNHIRENFPEHVELINKICNNIYTIIDKVMYVHAGIDPSVSLKEQNNSVMLWTRTDSFLSHFNQPFWYEYEEFDKVVHGHTPFMDVDISPKKIAVDTGCFHTGTLSAVKIVNGTYVDKFQEKGEKSYLWK